MKRICYVSRCTVGLVRQQFDQLVASSTKNNLRDDITGLLLYDENRFLQAVEGENDKIDECFERIRSDNRHRDISVFENGSIIDREFGQWSLRTRSALDLATIDFKAAVAKDISEVRSVKLKAMFIGFASMVRC